jgi:hypothetical protein
VALSALKLKTTKAGRYGDGGGLYLQVSHSSSKSWLFRFRSGTTGTGKPATRKMGLGSLADVTLAEARDKARDARRLIAEGINPIHNRKTVQQEKKVASERTFKQAMELYIAHAMEVGTWRDPLAERNWRQSLSDYACPVLGKLPVYEITPADVLRVLTPIWKTKSETASKVQQRIFRVLTHAKSLGWRSGLNPAQWRDSLDGSLPSPKKVKATKHHAALPYREAPIFMARLHGINDERPTPWLAVRGRRHLATTRPGHYRPSSQKRIACVCWCAGASTDCGRTAHPCSEPCRSRQAEVEDVWRGGR